MASSAVFSVDDDPAVKISTSVGRRRDVIVEIVTAASTVFLGGSGVTAAAGTPCATADPPLKLSLGENEDLWAITASGTVDVRVLTL